MVRLRRKLDEPRLEMMPLIDVVFLLITFFIYALVLMVRADLLPISLPELQAGEPADRVTPIVVQLDPLGQFHVNAEHVDGINGVILRLHELRLDKPNAPVFLAADKSGEADRLPLFFDLVDRMRKSGIGDFAIMGSRAPGE